MPNPAAGQQTFAEAFAAADAGAPGADNALVALVRDPAQAALVRASALAHLAQPLSPAGLSAATGALTGASDLLRLAAVQAFDGADAVARCYHLVVPLSDARRAVRIEAARVLAHGGAAQLPADAQPAYVRALSEYEASLRFAADRPEALVAQGNLRQAQGDAGGAEAAYQRASTIDATHSAGWINLADLQSRQRREPDALATLRAGLAATGGAADRLGGLGGFY